MATDVVFDVVARDRASEAFDKAGKSADGLTSKLGGIAKQAAILGGAAALGGFFKGAIDGAQESAKVTAQSEAVIKSTGGAANITAKQMADLAGSISKKTGVDDEAIQSAQNLLATFTNVKNGVGEGNDVFNEATKTLVDMGAALGTDASSSAIQLGKALNDPVAGISALSRVGVTFTDQQKAQIKAMVEAGDVAGAQKVILNELGKEFGGSAEAQATATDKLKVTFGNLQEQVGGLLVPVIEKLAGALTVVIDGFINASGPVKVAIVGVAGLAAGLVALNAIQGVVTAVQGLFTAGTVAHTVATTVASAATKAWAGVQAVLNVVLSANPIALVVLAIAALVAGIILAYQNSETFRNIVDAAFRAVAAVATTAFGVVVDVISGAFRFISDNWKTILAVLTGPIGLAVLVITTHWDTIKAGFTAVRDWIGARIGDVVGFFTGLPGRITSATSGLFDGIVTAFRSAINLIIRKWNDLKFTIGGGEIFGQKIPTFTLDTPNLPVFDTGGVFRSPIPGGHGLAILQDREVVFTPGQMAALASSGVGGAPNVRVFIGERELTDMVRVEVRDRDARLLGAIRAGAGKG